MSPARMSAAHRTNGVLDRYSQFDNIVRPAMLATLPVCAGQLLWRMSLRPDSLTPAEKEPSAARLAAHVLHSRYDSKELRRAWHARSSIKGSWTRSTPTGSYLRQNVCAASNTHEKRTSPVWL